MSDWKTEAVCKGTHPDTFFPSQGPWGVKAAIAVCRRCDVRMECLEYAVENVIDHGVWGGLTVDERQQLRRSRRRKLPA